jgi:hypothetical protein
MKHPRLFGLSAVLLVLSAAAMMTALILMNNFAPLAEQPDPTAARILDSVAVSGVIVFTAASAVLWIGALMDYWAGLTERSLVKNVWYLLLLLGFNWLAALVWYCRKQDQARKPAEAHR